MWLASKVVRMALPMLYTLAIMLQQPKPKHLHVAAAIMLAITTAMLHTAGTA
jgi:hypothetical protein